MDFPGSLEDLKAVIRLQHLQGHWVDEGALHTFHTEGGESINFWPERGELQVQGHPQASLQLSQILQQAITGLGS